ncbi:MAG TPA: RNA methyltransferase [Chitinophagaceae bacterium]|nr:RNA methyltransferase [Chitinophagaceae bacterium]
MLVKSKLKYIQTLGQKKFRQEERTFIAEGPKIVTELLQAKKEAIREIFALKEWIEENTVWVKQVNCTEISEQELERISQLSTPNKVLALVQQFEEDKVMITKDSITLVLDGIQDPGNLGTIIRIADWFGIGQVICSEDSTELYNPKVVQATMGSIARVNVCYTALHSWLAEQKDVPIYTAMLGGVDITEMERITEGIIIIGNESKGISPALLNRANTRITIPKKGNAESLNAAVAAGIILSHLS